MESKTMTLSPLQLMQRFYNDFNKQKQQPTKLEEIHCQYARNKSSNTDKMTKFLNDYEKRHRGTSTIISVNSTTHKASSSQNGSPNNSRYRTNTQTAKRCYFKNSFSESHPFLVSDHKIREKQLPQINTVKTEPVQASNPPILKQNYKFISPTENRNSVQDFKQKLIRIKMHKKERMEKVRYNYLINNCYKGHIEQNKNNGASRIRIRASEINTKERIFPTSNTVEAGLQF